MGAVEEPIVDGVGDGWVAEVVVPIRYRNLAGENRRARGVAVVGYLEKVAAMLVTELGKAPVIEDEHVEFASRV